MNWLEKQVSLYPYQAQNFGRPATLREVLLSSWGVRHHWEHYDKKTEREFSGNSIDVLTYPMLKRPGLSKYQKGLIKATLQAFTPAALLASKQKGYVQEISRSGLMQLDFDEAALVNYDIEEAKAAVFSLPFIAFCALSCTGTGFYALAVIAEPDRLTEYAEHCFVIFQKFGLRPDVSKGKNPQDLRYISYDPNMLIRDNPEPLKISKFYQKPVKQKTTPSSHPIIPGDYKGLVIVSLRKIAAAKVGDRWHTVQNVAWTLGGTGDESLLDLIHTEIDANNEFAGEEDKYKECADVCFTRGLDKPLPEKKP